MYACPKCHKPTTIDLPAAEDDSGAPLEVTCDICSATHPLTAFSKEHEHQERFKQKTLDRTAKRKGRLLRKAKDAVESSARYDRMMADRKAVYARQRRADAELLITEGKTTVGSWGLWVLSCLFLLGSLLGYADDKDGGPALIVAFLLLICITIERLRSAVLAMNTRMVNLALRDDDPTP